MKLPSTSPELRRALLAGVFVVLVGAAFTAYQAFAIKSGLEKSASSLRAAQQSISDSDLETAKTQLDEAGDAAGSAHFHAAWPTWWAATALPGVGDDVAAVREVTYVADKLTNEALPPLVAEADNLDAKSFAPVNGRVALQPIADAAPALVTGAEQISDARLRLDAIETDGLVPRLATEVADAQQRFADVDTLAQRASKAARLLPTMLGSEEKRTYLVLFQNNAEIRALGGMPGAMAIVTTNNGKIALTRQGRPATIGYAPKKSVELTAEEEALFSTRLQRFPQATVSVPDFPRAAELVSAMWEETQPEELDGVISVDPTALSYALRGVGSVQLSDGSELTAGNAVQLLQRDIYLKDLPPQVENDFFDNVAQRVVGALTKRVGEPRKTVEGLVQGASEGRLLLWSRDTREQQIVSGSVVARELPVEPTQSPELGVYIDNSAADKLSYYLDYEINLTPVACSSDGRQTYQLSMPIRSSVPKGTTGPRALVGPVDDIVQAGVMLNTFSLYAPIGGSLDNIEVDGVPAPVGERSYRGRQVSKISAALEPGETRTITATVRSGKNQPGEVNVLSTPASNTTGAGTIGAPTC